MEEDTRVAHDRGQLSAPELQQIVNDVLAELRSEPGLAELAKSAGLSVADVQTLTVEVSESHSPIDPVTAFILVHLASGAVSAAGGGGATVFWKKVILPRVRKRKGGDAIGEARPDADERAGGGERPDAT
jgi:hypothetical protein